MMKIFLTVLFCLVTGLCSAQKTPSYRDSLKTSIQQATNGKDRLRSQVFLVFDQLVFGNFDIADSLIKENVAGMTEWTNPEDIVYGLLCLSNNLGTGFPEKKTYFSQGCAWAERGLKLAQSKKLSDYVPGFYVALSTMYLDNGNWDKATENMNNAMALVNDVTNDSLKAVGYAGIAYYFNSKKDFTQAFRYYARELRSAEKSKSAYEQHLALSHLSNFYLDLGDDEKARDYIMRDIEMCKKIADNSCILLAYDNIWYLYHKQKEYVLAEKYILAGLSIAERNNNITWKSILLNDLSIVYSRTNNYAKARKLYADNPEAMQRYANLVPGTTYENLTIIDEFKAKQQYDSALFYFEKDFAYTKKAYGDYPGLTDYYNSGGRLYVKAKQYGKAIPLLTSTYNMALKNYNYNAAQRAAAYLDTAYRATSQFEKALLYSSEYYRLKDTLQQLKLNKDLSLAQVNEEAIRVEEELKAEELKTHQRHNIQYVLIIGLIVSLFIGMVLMGMFKVSASTIRLLGFFSFLFLFEFIFLLLKKQLHGLTHDEPWRELMMMIVLAAILLPLHHAMEHKVVHYLSHRKWIVPDRKSIMAKIFGKQKMVISEPEMTSEG